MHSTTTAIREASRTHQLPVNADSAGDPLSNAAQMPTGRSAQDILMEGLCAMYGGLKAEPVPVHIVALVERHCRGA